jgi:hypothetical protein
MNMDMKKLLRAMPEALMIQIGRATTTTDTPHTGVHYTQGMFHHAVTQDEASVD